MPTYARTSLSSAPAQQKYTGSRCVRHVAEADLLSTSRISWKKATFRQKGKGPHSWLWRKESNLEGSRGKIPGENTGDVKVSRPPTPHVSYPLYSRTRTQMAPYSLHVLGRVVCGAMHLSTGRVFCPLLVTSGLSPGPSAKRATERVTN